MNTTIAAVEPCSKNDFLRGIRGTELKVLHDTGAYKHLNFVQVGDNPYSPFPSFDLMFWPKGITFRAYCCTYAFDLDVSIPDLSRLAEITLDTVDIDYLTSMLSASMINCQPTQVDPYLFEQALWHQVDTWRFASKDEGEVVRHDIVDKILRHMDPPYWEVPTTFESYVSPFGHTFEKFPIPMEYTSRYLQCVYSLVWGIQKYLEDTVSNNE